MVNGQKAWDASRDKTRAGDRLHYWDSLTDHELDQRFAYLARCGWDLVYLLVHWSFCERLDAGGRLAPHGAEQLALYLRTAARHGLVHLQALSHYPYASPEASKGTNTIPYAQYLEAGFRTEDWPNPGKNQPFETMFHHYVRDVIELFKDETSLLAWSASGEGDLANGLARSNDIFSSVRSIDPRHLFVAEPDSRLTKLPEAQTAGWHQDLLGARTYWIGSEQPAEFDFGVDYKLYRS
jgi:hypothetical protein